MKNRYRFLILISAFLLVGCSSIKIIDKETTSSILFRNIVTNSEKVSNAYLSGMLRITGVPEIPSGAYISYLFHGNIKESYGMFSLSLFKKPIFEIYFNGNDFTLVNCKKKIYVKSTLDEVDYSKYIGVNINPIDIAYFLLGVVPYSPELELLNYEATKDAHILDISTNVSTFKVRLNADEEIVSADINNQYFDNVLMNNVKYTKNDDGDNVPQSAVFYTEDKKKSINFIIDRTSFKRPYDASLLEQKIQDSQYTQIDNIVDFDFKF